MTALRAEPLNENLRFIGVEVGRGISVESQPETLDEIEVRTVAGKELQFKVAKNYLNPPANPHGCDIGPLVRKLG